MLARRIRSVGGGTFTQTGELFDTFDGVPWVKYAGNPVLTKGAAGSWDSLGLRDPNMMIESNGYMAIEGGLMVMYYSGYKSAAPHYERQIGRATSPDGITWTKYASNPVLGPGAGGTWDEFGVQAANVIKRGVGDYIMIYSGVDDDWSDADSWGIGIATSADGLSWTRSVGNPVLDKTDFTGITGNNILSFPYMIQLLDGTYFMACGATFGAGDVFQIYGATSNDGLTWTAINSGNPILTPGGGGWDTDNIEGPRLYELGANQYVMSYHGDPGGANDGAMKLHLAYSTNKTSWTRYASNAVMEPGAGTWDDFRVENMVMAKDDLWGGRIRMWYSGAPTIDGEDESAIGYATCDQ